MTLQIPFRGQRNVVKLATGLFLFGTVLLLHAPASAQTVAAADRGKAMDAIAKRFESLAPVSSHQRLSQTIQFARSLKEIRYAAATSSGDVGCIFKDGVPYLLQVPSLRHSLPETTLRFASDAWTERVAATKSEIDFTSLPPSFTNADAEEPELPSSNRAILVAGSNGCRRTFANLDKLFGSHGYATESIVSSTVGQIAGLGQAGIVYLQIGAALGPSIVSGRFDEVPMFPTGDKWSAESERKIYAHGRLGQIGWLETYGTNPKLGRQRVAMVSQHFLEETWDSTVRRLVVLVGPNSQMIADQLASGKLGSTTFCAFVSNATEGVPLAAQSFLARALGAREPVGAGDTNESPDRPFDVRAIAEDMGRQFIWASVEGAVDPRTLGMPYVSSGSETLLAAPSIKHAVAVGNTRDVEIEGTFGADPGPSKRKVTLKGVAVTIKKWTPAKITIELPNDVTKAKGELTVVHTGRRSNSRWLSSWNGGIQISITGEGTLNLKANFGFTLIGDPWPYRESPSSQPKAPMFLTFVNVIGASCNWTATGENRAEDGTVLTAWSGNGTPKVWIDVPPGPNFQLPSRRGTFAVGATGDTFQNVVNLNPGMLEDMDLTESGNVQKVPIKLGDFLDGQTIIQPRFDSAFKIARRVETITDEPSKLSYGGLNGTMESIEMVCNSPMPANAPR